MEREKYRGHKIKKDIIVLNDKMIKDQFLFTILRESDRE